MDTDSLTKPLVMIVDDFKMIRETLAQILSEAGYEVVQASSAEQCIEDASAVKPDIILMDMSMPGKSGIDAVLELRKDNATREIPIIFLTAHGTEIGCAIPSSVSFQGMLSKPCMPEELVSTIRNILPPAGPKTRVAASPAS